MRIVLILILSIQSFLMADDKEIIKFGKKLMPGMKINIDIEKTLLEFSEIIDSNDSVMKHVNKKIKLNASYILTIIEVDNKQMPIKASINFSKIKAANLNNEFDYPILTGVEYYISFSNNKVYAKFNEKSLNNNWIFNTLVCINVCLPDVEYIKNSEIKPDERSVVATPEEFKIPKYYELDKDTFKKPIIEKNSQNKNFSIKYEEMFKFKIIKEIAKKSNINEGEINVKSNASYEIDPDGYVINYKNENVKNTQEKYFEQLFNDEVTKVEIISGNTEIKMNYLTESFK